MLHPEAQHNTTVFWSCTPALSSTVYQINFAVEQDAPTGYSFLLKETQEANNLPVWAYLSKEHLSMMDHLLGQRLARMIDISTILMQTNGL